MMAISKVLKNQGNSIQNRNRSRGKAIFRIAFRGCEGEKLAEINSLLAINEDNFEAYAPLNRILKGLYPHDRLLKIRSVYFL